MITVYAATKPNLGRDRYALTPDREVADAIAFSCAGRVIELVDKAAILRKFDDYVPADVASSMRWRIRELEAQVAELRAAPTPVEKPRPLGDLNFAEVTKAVRRFCSMSATIESVAASMRGACASFSGQHRDGGMVPGVALPPAPDLPGEVRVSALTTNDTAIAGAVWPASSAAVKSAVLYNDRAPDERIELFFNPSRCACAKCDAEVSPFRFRMNVCPECGSKRCPRADDHDLKCHVVDARFDPVADAARTMPLGQQRSTKDLGEALARYAGAEVVTDPAAIEAAFRAEEEGPISRVRVTRGAAGYTPHKLNDAFEHRALADGLDEQCEAFAGMPFGVLEDLGLA